MAMTRERATWLAAGVAALAVAALFLAPSFVYIVNEREFAVVLRFGRPVAERLEPGLYFKTPLVEEVVKLPRTRQIWRPEEALSDLPTHEGNKINLTPWALWRIKSPMEYVSRLGSRTDPGEARVAQIVRAAFRDQVTQHDLLSLIRSSTRKLEFSFGVAPGEDELNPPPVPGKAFVGRSEILALVRKDAEARLQQSLRRDANDSVVVVELVDIGISTIEFSKTVQERAFDRQRTRMEALAARQLNEGERQKQEIVNAAQAEVKKVQAEGQKQANIVRGEADAYAIKQYAAAMKEMGEFYTFFRTLEAYKKSLSGQSHLFLSTDNEFLRYLSRLNTLPPPPPAGAPAGPALPILPPVRAEAAAPAP